MRLRSECASLTDVGKKRNKNEDSVLAFKDERIALLAVADGIGGHRKGEVASDMAISIIHENVVHFDKAFTLSNAKKLIKSSIKSANKIINDMSLKPDYLDMGSTLVLALVLDEVTFVANIGDSRLYAYNKSKGLRKITVDQTYVQYMVQNGRMTQQEAAVSPKRNVLLNALGVNPGVYFDEHVIRNEYDALLLCSDGLYNMVESAEILEVLGSNMPTASKAERLVTLANEHGGLDNIGVSLMEVLR